MSVPHSPWHLEQTQKITDEQVSIHSTIWGLLSSTGNREFRLQDFWWSDTSQDHRRVRQNSAKRPWASHTVWMLSLCWGTELLEIFVFEVSQNLFLFISACFLMFILLLQLLLLWFCFEKLSHYVDPAWPQTHRHLHTSASQVLGLKMHATTPRKNLIFVCLF